MDSSFSADDSFPVPAGRSEGEYRIRGSRFLSIAKGVESVREAADLRDGSRRRFHDATHHVYGFVPLEGAPRGDDDGEPAGTGWRPVVMEIGARGLRNTAVVVVRYFGGTKLGTGGLARAYAAAASAALDRLPTRRVRRGRRLRLRYPYSATGAIVRCVEQCGAARIAEEYGERPVLVVGVPEARVEELRRGVAEVTGGAAELEDAGEAVLIPLST